MQIPLDQVLLFTILIVAFSGLYPRVVQVGSVIDCQAGGSLCNTAAGGFRHSLFTMRLMSSSNLRLRDFPASEIPEYAILSHTWGEDEVLFADIEKGTLKDRKAGYEKIQYSCRQAAAHGLDYVWIDTCCIDKSSSAELSEAINSMYSWYQGATKCYAYLGDVPTNVDANDLNSAFAKSKWFKRGWTLQELIGPTELIFFSRDWIKVGTKLTLQDVLAQITGISVGILTGANDLESASVALRMSWASHRETTRKEDIAYCLMGLFDVHMPLLYGEGEKAFIRLQEEIMKHSDDHSLFSWTDLDTPADSHYGLLANSPKNFANSANFMPYRGWEPTAPYSISNKGLRIELHLSPHGEDLFVAALECPVPPEYEGFLGIYLKRVSTEDHQYARVKPQTLCKLRARGGIETVYVRQSMPKHGPQVIYPVHAFKLRKCPTQEDGYKVFQACSCSSEIASAAPLPHTTRLTAEKTTFRISKEAGRLAGALILERTDGERLVILLGSTTEFEVGFEATSLCDIGYFDFEKFQKSFNPRAPGTNIVLENHQVRVNATPRIDSRTKYYMVDIFVEAIYHHPRDPIDVITETTSRGFRKFLHPFKSSRK